MPAAEQLYSNVSDLGSVQRQRGLGAEAQSADPAVSHFNAAGAVKLSESELNGESTALGLAD